VRVVASARADVVGDDEHRPATIEGHELVYPVLGRRHHDYRAAARGRRTTKGASTAGKIIAPSLLDLGLFIGGAGPPINKLARFASVAGGDASFAFHANAKLARRATRAVAARGSVCCWRSFSTGRHVFATREKVAHNG
jgi:hypothetical protein